MSLWLLNFVLILPRTSCLKLIFFTVWIDLGDFDEAVMNIVSVNIGEYSRDRARGREPIEPKRADSFGTRLRAHLKASQAKPVHGGPVAESGRPAERSCVR